MPDDIQKRKPTSEVYEFTFDFNFDLMRRDTNLTSVRMDYSNYGGYWDQIVNSDGIQDSSSKSRKRYFAPTIFDWKDMYKNMNFEDAKFTSAPQKFSVDMSKEIFWETKDSVCTTSYVLLCWAYVLNLLIYSVIGRAQTMVTALAHGYKEMWMPSCTTATPLS